MDKQKKLKIALPILLVVMAFVWGPVFFGSDSKNQSNKNTDKGSVKNKVSNNNDSGSNISAPSRAYARKKEQTPDVAGWGRNPFMLGYDSKALMIEGIVWDEENPKAIINGDILGVGDTVGSSVIIGIDQKSVIIRSKSGEDTKLYLGERKQF